MQDRRTFLKVLPGAVLAPAAFLQPGRAAEAAAALAKWGGAPEDLADDEAFWFEVARAFSVDRSVINLNNGGVSPSPSFVQAAMKRHLDYANTAPTSHALWRVQQPQVEGLRQRLAAQFGVDAEEIALTRNASESLQICQFGFDLARGDEVVTSNRDYPRMINTFRQRARRDGIVFRQVSLRGLDDDTAGIVDRFRRAITPRTKLMLISHMVFLNGQLLPVREIVAMARRRGVPVIVDGAHALAHADFKISDLGCDYYAASLHKWLHAPHGTGILYVRKPKIRALWPLMAAAETQDDSIRKFEEIGTHPLANTLATAEALTFYQGIGPARKAARLTFLREYWAKRLLRDPRFKLHTSRRAGRACGIATVELTGVDIGQLYGWLWRKHRILTTPIKHRDFAGLRVSPSVYTTTEELDRFVAAMRHAAAGALPAPKPKKRRSV